MPTRLPVWGATLPPFMVSAPRFMGWGLTFWGAGRAGSDWDAGDARRAQEDGAPSRCSHAHTHINTHT
eukprot:3807475-Rhodomonas_salina.2